MIKSLNLNGESTIYEMDTLMDIFVQRIRENPRVAPYERRLLGAFREIDDHLRRPTLLKVIDFMENWLKREFEQISDLDGENTRDFRPIYELKGSVRIVRHDDWPSLLAHMPLVMLLRHHRPFIWYTPRLAFYLSKQSISTQELDEIRNHCLQKRDAERNVPQSPGRILQAKVKEIGDIPAGSSGNEPRRRRNSSQTLVSDQYNCSICCHEYDLSMRRPMIIANCGHTFCQNCLERLKVDKLACPDCRGSIRATTENYAFKGLIEEKKRIQKRSEERREIALAGENEQRSLEAIRTSLQSDLDAKPLQKSTGDSSDPKMLIDQQQNQINHFEIAEMKRQLAEIRIKEQSEAKKRSLMELKLAQIGEKLESSDSIKEESGLDKCAVLISGLPEKKGAATRIFKDMQSKVTDQPLKIEFSQPASLGLVILRFQTNETAAKFIEEYNHTLYGDTDSLMKMEYATIGLDIRSADPAQESSNVSYIPKSPQVQQNHIPTIDRKRVFIQNLPAHATPQNIIKWIFNDSPNLVDSSLTLNRFRQSDTQICTARFDSEQDVIELMAKFNNQPYPGSSYLLRVSMFNPPKTRSESRDPYRKPSTGNARFSRKTPACPPPTSPHPISQPNYQNATTILPNNEKIRQRDYPVPPPFLLSRDPYRQPSTGNARFSRKTSVSPPPTSPRPIISQPSYQNPTTILPNNQKIRQSDYSAPPSLLPIPIQQQNSAVLVSNLPLTTTRLDLIEYFHKKCLEGTEVQIADQTSIRFIENGLPNRPTRECLIDFRTDSEAILVHRYFNDRPLFAGGQRIKVELWHSMIGKQASTAASSHQNQPNSTTVLVRNLPWDTRVDEIVETFHPICKIAFYPNTLQPMVNLKPEPDGSISAIIGFKEGEAAQKIVHLFRAHNYNGTGRIIQASLI